MVNTVLEKIPAEALGRCQVHEHIFVRHTPMASLNPALEISEEDLSLNELKTYKEKGGGAIVDAQPVFAGRDAEALKRLSSESGVHIIASTGFHLEGFYREDSPFFSMTEDELYALFVSEIEDGMLAFGKERGIRTGIKAGLVKAAIPQSGMAGAYEKRIRAAARAARECGVPIMLHTEKGQGALETVNAVLSLGVAPSKILVCHVDRQASDFYIHEDIAKLGVFLEYDTIGRFKYHSDEAEAELIAHMISLGYEDRLLLSLDTTAARLGSYGGGINLNYITEKFVPLLKNYGISSDTVSKIINENPLKIFK